MFKNKNNYSIRKLSIGAASILVSTFFYSSSHHLIHADNLNDKDDNSPYFHEHIQNSDTLTKSKNQNVASEKESEASNPNKENTTKTDNQNVANQKESEEPNSNEENTTKIDNQNVASEKEPETSNSNEENTIKTDNQNVANQKESEEPNSNEENTIKTDNQNVANQKESEEPNSNEENTTKTDNQNVANQKESEEPNSNEENTIKTDNQNVANQKESEEPNSNEENTTKTDNQNVANQKESEEPNSNEENTTKIDNQNVASEKEPETSNSNEENTIKTDNQNVANQKESEEPNPNKENTTKTDNQNVANQKESEEPNSNEENTKNIRRQSSITPLSMKNNQKLTLKTLDSKAINRNKVQKEDSAKKKNLSVDEINSSVQWVDFRSTDAEIKDTNGNILKKKGVEAPDNFQLKKGMVLEREIAPGYTFKAIVKDLKPFEATDIYKNRVESLAKNANSEEKRKKILSSYHPDAINRSPWKGGGPTNVVARKVDKEYSHLAKSGINLPDSVYGSPDDGGDIGATFGVSVIGPDGREVPVSIVMADAEEANDDEFLTMVTNGKSWEQIADVHRPDKDGHYRKPNNLDKNLTEDKGFYSPAWYNNNEELGLGSQVFGPAVTSLNGGSVPILYSKDASEISYYIASHGMQQVAFGIMLEDTGDAPDSYGEASHVITPKKGEQQPYLGSVPADINLTDSVSQSHLKNWVGDDENDQPDEGEAQLAAKDSNYDVVKYNVINTKSDNYKLNIKANSGSFDKSYISAWIDFNNNGKFDEDEQATAIVSGKDNNISLIFSKDAVKNMDKNASNLGARVRIAANPDDVANPTGQAFTGEVEDFLIPVATPPKGSVKHVEGKQGQKVSDKVLFEPNSNNTNETIMDNNRPAKLIDWDNGGALVDSIYIDGEGLYKVNADGTVEFTPDKDFTGEGHGVTIRRWDTNRLSTEWVSDNNVNNNGEDTMDGMFIPYINPVLPEGKNTTSTGKQGQAQQGQPEFKGGDPSVGIDDTVPPKLVDSEGNLVNDVNVPGEGQYHINPDGTVVFTPEKGFTGEAQGVTVQRQDMNGTKVTATYTPTVTPVVPEGKNATSTGKQGQTQQGQPGFKGGDPSVGIDDTVPPKLVDSEGNLVNDVNVPGEGQYHINPDGTVVFTPEKGFTGEAQGVTVQRQDMNGTKVTATYTPTVTPVVPEGKNATSTGKQGQTQQGQPGFKGGDPSVGIDDTVPPKLVDSEGNLVNDVNVPGEGQYHINPDGTVVFTPEKGFTGEAQGVTVQRQDMNGTKVTATYTPTVTPVAPEGKNATSTGKQGQTQQGQPGFKGGDPSVGIDDTVPPKLVDSEGNLVNDVNVPGEGQYHINPDGTVVFTPEKGFTGEAQGVTVQRQDMNGTKVTATYTPTVTPVVPEGKNATSTGKQGQTQQGQPGFKGGDPSVGIDDTVPPKLVDSEGNLVNDVNVPGEGQYHINPDGTVVFTPEKGFTGEAQGVTVQRQDMNGTKVTATYTPTVTPVVPEGKNATSTGKQGQTQQGQPGFKGGDPSVGIDDTVPPKLVDSEGNLVNDVNVPGEGQYHINPDGTVVFTPEKGFTGEAQGVAVQRQDMNGTKVTATYTPTVTPVVPEGKNATSTGKQGQTQQGQPEFKGGDPSVGIDDTVPPKLVDSEGNLVNDVNVPGEGQYHINPDGTVVFTPEKGFTGEAQGVTVQRQDMNGTKVTATYTPTVTPVVPEGKNATSTGKQGQTQQGQPEFKGGDPSVGIDDTVPPKLVDSEGNLVNDVNVPGEGQYHINSDGTVVFTPGKGFTGEAQGVTVQRQDMNGTKVTATYLSLKNNNTLPETGGSKSENPFIYLLTLISGTLILLFRRKKEKR